MLMLEVANLLLNLAMLAAVIAGGAVLRRLYFSVRTEITSIGDAGRHVRRLIAQSDALLRENEEAWRRYEAAAADAEAQRLRFLKHKVEERTAQRGANGDDAEGAGGVAE